MYFVIIYLFITYIYLFHHSFIYLKTHHQLFISWSIYCRGLFISSLFYLFQNSPTFFSWSIYCRGLFIYFLYTPNQWEWTWMIRHHALRQGGGALCTQASPPGGHLGTEPEVLKQQQMTGWQSVTVRKVTDRRW